MGIKVYVWNSSVEIESGREGGRGKSAVKYQIMCVDIEDSMKQC
jgi:hypothetical protein